MANKIPISIIISVIILVLLAGSFMKMPFVSWGGGDGEINVNNNCDFAMDTFTAGAGEGECFVNRDDRPSYVESIFQTQRTGPSGLTDFCIIDVCYSCDEVFTCEYANEDDGTKVKVCKLDSECTSNKCVNHLCVGGQPSDICTPYESRCATNNIRNYQKCLANGLWGGILTCPIGKICSEGICEGCSGWRTCESEGKDECGVVDDGCGNYLNCGTCSGGKVCSNDGRCITIEEFEQEDEEQEDEEQEQEEEEEQEDEEEEEFDWNTKTIGNLPLWGLLAIIGGIFLMIILMRKK